MLRYSILGDIWESLVNRMRASEPLEDGAFVLGRPVKTANGWRIVIDKEVTSADGSGRWAVQEDRRLKPTTRYKSRTMGLANQSNRIPVFIHSHPRGPAAFSGADDWAHEAWAPNFIEVVGQDSFGSIVVSKGTSILGDLWVDNTRIEADVVDTGGRFPRRTSRKALDSRRELLDMDPEEEVDRQVRLWNTYRQALLESATVGVVGLGGTGSTTAVLLARSNVGNLKLFDFDRVEPSNQNRLLGLTQEQIDTAAKKIGVLSDHLGRISDVAVETYDADITEGENNSSLLACDLLIGCTDNHQSRAYLNKLAVLYGVPYIDVGTRPSAGTQGVTDLFVDIRRVTTGGPCLHCMDVLDTGRMRAESLSEEQREQEIKDGYTRGFGIDPSLGPMTTLAGSMGVSQALAFLTNQDVVWDQQTIFNAWTGGLQKGVTEQDSKCICNAGRWRPTIDDIDLTVH